MDPISKQSEEAAAKLSKHGLRVLVYTDRGKSDEQICISPNKTLTVMVKILAVFEGGKRIA